MSDENRNEAGQFAETPEPAFGREGVEREAGYLPYKEEPAADSEELTVAEAAEQLAAQSGPESEIRTYSAIDDLPDNVSLTPEQGAKLLSDSWDAEAKTAEQAEAEAL